MWETGFSIEPHFLWLAVARLFSVSCLFYFGGVVVKTVSVCMEQKIFSLFFFALRLLFLPHILTRVGSASEHNGDRKPGGDRNISTFVAV